MTFLRNVFTSCEENDGIGVYMGGDHITLKLDMDV